MILPLFFAIAAVSGDWTGTSLCTDLKALPGCHDETALYHFTPKGGNLVHCVGEKIVDGKPQYMGEFDMTQNGARLTYEMTNGRGERVLWTFDVDGDHMTGTLKMLPGNEVVRKIDVRKKR